ncbi:septum formation initiator family protein [Candidatus Giovannonibacteria bacterium]|nr:septum formation initiator family protein [Candidatus Giovannonibacteria bacterium]
MRDFQEKKRIERIMSSGPVLFCLLIILLAALWGTGKMWRIRLGIGNEISGLEAKLAKTHSERMEFEKKFRALSSPEGLEKESRERFNFRKPGEKVVVFLDDESQASASGKAGPNFFISFFNKIIKYFDE